MADWPAQTVVEVAATVKTGNAFTVIVLLRVLVQPLRAVPVTVYTFAETAGVSVTTEVVGPELQLYVAAPLTVCESELPAQTAVLPVTASVGTGIMLTLFVNEPVLQLAPPLIVTE